MTFTRAAAWADGLPCPTGKVQFTNRKAARDAAIRLATETGRPWGVYRCDKCRRHHLSAHPLRKTKVLQPRRRT